MPVLTPTTLQQVMRCPQSRADECYPEMVAAMRVFSINSPAEMACFLAQVDWESAGLVYFAELASGDAYNGRTDLGNIYPGDGPRFKGSGPIQVTGRDNFTNANTALHDDGLLPASIDIVQDPDQARTVKFGFLISCYWWAHNQFPAPLTNCNIVAEKAGNIACGRAVNRGNPYSSYPAQNEAERIAAYNRVTSFGTWSLPDDPAQPTDLIGALMATDADKKALQDIVDAVVKVHVDQAVKDVNAYNLVRHTARYDAERKVLWRLAMVLNFLQERCREHGLLPKKYKDWNTQEANAAKTGYRS